MKFHFCVDDVHLDHLPDRKGFIYLFLVFFCYWLVKKKLIYLFLLETNYFTGFPSGSDGKASACNAEDSGSIPGSGRFPGEVNGNPVQYSCLENSMDGGAW